MSHKRSWRERLETPPSFICAAHWSDEWDCVLPVAHHGQHKSRSGRFWFFGEETGSRAEHLQAMARYHDIADAHEALLAALERLAEEWKGIGPSEAGCASDLLDIIDTNNAFRNT